MKKNLFFSVALGVALMTASCDQANTTENTTTDATAATTTEQPQAVAVDNPNIAASEPVVASENAPAFTFKETEYDFGTIKQGEIVEHVFEFTNSGKSPLIIESASASCGCTAPEWTSEPVAPGASGKIKVVFNSTGKGGQQAPTVTIRANTEPNLTKVSMKGNVQASTMPTAGAEGPVKLN
ncbi:DUF1573 domain-containing protein [Pontibacter vulgaris]|uniref:DUF1573 domain-containing protein n=1 Tax=Pontibacter vulgaris TaxID=2905679 RepID=UPI001FA76F20|nr:DUF1573 domain-containing protein [Pontibacter vulgaris]